MKTHIVSNNEVINKGVDAYADEYAAVFAVKTPVLDHSGLCHLIEHMVFRGSEKYPCSHELFLINHLLPAKVNASTQNGYTFYFVSTPDESLFYHLLDFIFHGLIQTEYKESEVSFEKDGVLYQELQMYEANEDYLLYSSALRGDTSGNNYYHYGGFTDTVSKNTLAEIKVYKRHYYHRKNLSLYINGPKIDEQYLEKWIEENDADDEPASSYHSASKAIDIKSLESTKLALTWRLNASFFSSLEAKLELIKSHLESKDRAFIDTEVNSENQIAFRVIAKQPDRAQEIVSDCLQTLYQDKAPDPFQFSKFPQQIKTLLSYALERESKTNSFSSVSTLNDLTPTTSYLCPIEYTEASIIDAKPTVFNSSFASLYPEALSIDNIPNLPKLFNPLARSVGFDTPFISDANNWIFCVGEHCFTKLRDVMLTSEFWMPRLSGELYAIGSGVFENQVFVYGANDKKTSERAEWINDLLI